MGIVVLLLLDHPLRGPHGRRPRQRGRRARWRGHGRAKVWRGRRILNLLVGRLASLALLLLVIGAAMDAAAADLVEGFDAWDGGVA